MNRYQKYQECLKARADMLNILKEIKAKQAKKTDNQRTKPPESHGISISISITINFIKKTA